MSKQKEEVMSVQILPNTTSNPPGKLADAEVIFGAQAGPLSGLKLVGFAVWERRAGGRNVTFPARAYSVNGERRSLRRAHRGPLVVSWSTPRESTLRCDGAGSRPHGESPR
jgi:hypothetical protein